MSTTTTLTLAIAAIAANVFFILNVWLKSRRVEPRTYANSLQSVEERLRRDDQLDPEERQRLIEQVAEIKQSLAQHKERPGTQEEEGAQEEQGAQGRPEPLTVPWYEWVAGIAAVVALIGLFAYIAQIVQPVGILSWIGLGLVAGVLAKIIMPGSDPGGIIITVLIGIIGGSLGNLIGQTVGLGGVTGFNLVSILWAVAGSLLLLVAYRLLTRRA